MMFSVLLSAGFVVHHSVAAYRAGLLASTAISLDPNIGIKPYVEEFFTQNNAQEMLSIIKCESGFKQFDTRGEVLKNKEGSSAVGIAQIIASKHPDQKVLDQYNKRNNTDLTVNDFDITTLKGNVGYALVLYKVRGTRDWECAKN
jgi:predicted metal-binding protein